QVLDSPGSSSTQMKVVWWMFTFRAVNFVRAKAGPRSSVGGQAGLEWMKLSGEEFEKLSLEHMDMLYRIARRLTGGDQAAAEDLVQETYLRAFRARETFSLHEQYGMKPWLLR